MRPRYGVLGAVVVVIVIAAVVLAASLYTVAETEWVVITQFKRPIEGSDKIGPGIHFKTPFIQTVNRIEKRLISWDGDPNRIPTRDKKYIYVDTYARWRVSDPLSFFRRLQGRTDMGQKKLPK